MDTANASAIPSSDSDAAQAPPPKLWRPLSETERRVLGVLIEKAKTTPDVYPMTANAVRTGCNQKNNRDPLTNLDEDDVEETLEKLREAGVVTRIEGNGRAIKYKHNAYPWMGVDKVECGVMAELLLRGDQTEGELRGRASRMEESLATLDDLRPVLKSLKDKGLVVSLTPEGRGHVVTHLLYQPDELAHVRRKHAGAASRPELDRPASAPRPRAESCSAASATSSAASATPAAESLQALMGPIAEQFADLKRQLAEQAAQLTCQRNATAALESRTAKLESSLAALTETAAHLAARTAAAETALAACRTDLAALRKDLGG